MAKTNGFFRPLPADKRNEKSLGGMSKLPSEEKERLRKARGERPGDNVAPAPKEPPAHLRIGGALPPIS